MNYILKVTQEFGRGLYASFDIPKDKILFTAELLVLSEQDTKVVNTTDLQWYTFKYDDTRDCLVLGDGEIFNHNDSPNVGYKLGDFDGRKVMYFYTVKDVKADEQLFIDYGADVVVKTNEYKVNLIG